MAGIIKKIKSSVRGVQNNGNHYTAFLYVYKILCCLLPTWISWIFIVESDVEYTYILTLLLSLYGTVMLVEPDDPEQPLLQFVDPEFPESAASV